MHVEIALKSIVPQDYGLTKEVTEAEIQLVMSVLSSTVYDLFEVAFPIEDFRAYYGSVWILYLVLQFGRSF